MKKLYICTMNGLTTRIYRNCKELPELEGSNFFHSRQLFEMLLKTPRQKPYLVVTTDESGRVVSHLLGIVRIRTYWLPPFVILHARILSEGVYAESDYPKEELMAEMMAKPL